MEKRSRRRIRDLVAQAASQGLSENEIGCARISIVAGSKNAPIHGPDTEAQDLCLHRTFRLATHGRSIQLCQNQTHAAQQKETYSNSSSARPDRGSGTVMPSSLAVFRLMISSTFVACWTGSSAGFSPLRIRPVYTPSGRYVSTMVVP